MSRQQFTSRNNIGQVLTFQKSGSTSSFDPFITFSGGSKRVSWKLDNGVGTTLVAGNSITYTGFTSDTSIREIQMKGNGFKDLNQFVIDGDNIYGELDMSLLPNINYIILNNNLNLTGITHTFSSQNFIAYLIQSCNLIGNLDLTKLSGLGGDFRVNNNTNLTGITHTASTHVFTSYIADNCKLTGNHDLSMFPNLGGSFRVNNNTNLTGITHSPSAQNFTQYYAHICNLTGNLDLTPLSGLGGQFFAYNNTNLTGITHSPSPNTFTSYSVPNCNLTGNLDLTPLSGLGGNIQYNNNSNLTGITHSQSPNNFTGYYGYNCDLTGNLDLTPLSGLGGQMLVQNNPKLTGITHSISNNIFSDYSVNNCDLKGTFDLTPLPKIGGSITLYSNSGLTNVLFTTNTQNIIQLDIYNCNLTGTIDISPLTKLGGSSSAVTYTLIRLQSNPNLTNIILPNTNQYFKNSANNEINGAFALNNCNLDYVDFTPLSGATFLTGTTQGTPRISLRDNGMSTTDVNHVLVDFSGNATYNPTGWSNVNLNISGTNGAPDSSSGGYNGISARNFLTGSPYNWTITHT